MWFSTKPYQWSNLKNKIMFQQKGHKVLISHKPCLWEFHLRLCYRKKENVKKKKAWTIETSGINPRERWQAIPGLETSNSDGEQEQNPPGERLEGKIICDWVEKAEKKTENTRKANGIRKSGRGFEI